MLPFYHSKPSALYYMLQATATGPSYSARPQIINATRIASRLAACPFHVTPSSRQSLSHHQANDRKLYVRVRIQIYSRKSSKLSSGQRSLQGWRRAQQWRYEPKAVVIHLTSRSPSSKLRHGSSSIAYQFLYSHPYSSTIPCHTTNSTQCPTTKASLSSCSAARKQTVARSCQPYSLASTVRTSARVADPD